MEKLETNVIKPQISFIENEQNYRIVTEEVEELLDGKIKGIKDFINTKTGKGQSEQIKDQLYLEAQKLWKEMSQELNASKYDFYLDKPQHKFLTDLILNKLEYDVNTVFFAIELKELFDFMKESKYKNESELISYKVTATEMTYIYHLISKHKIKGLVKDSFLFAEVLMKIGNISKLINFYDTTGKNLSTEINDWVVTFEDGVTKEQRPSKEEEESVSGLAL